MAPRNGSTLIAPKSSARPFGSGNSLPDFRNEPPLDFSSREERETFARTLREVRAIFPRDVPMVIDGQRQETAEKRDNTSPNDRSMVIGRSSMASVADADRAAQVARKAFLRWSAMPAQERAAILVEFAALLRENRRILAGVMVFEGAKPWREADADVCEAIDFVEYYAREALRLGRPTRLQPYLMGERNELTYAPLGVVAVIGPWNFPLAIPLGMTIAAVAAGNAVVVKPAEPTPVILSVMMDIVEKSSIPRGVINLLPGRGSVIGARLVSHPLVNMIAFTGSKEVGLRIAAEAARVPEGSIFVKRVIAEMGGKNAIIVDSSADIDSSVPDVLYSAFGYSGQKCSACSRLIVLEDIYDEVIARLKDAASSLKIGPADHPGTQVGPVINEASAEKIRSYIELGMREAKPVFVGDVTELAKQGTYVSPCIFDGIKPKDRLAQEEIFGPVSSVLKAKTFRQALDIANSTEFALTGGVHSRTLGNLDIARSAFNVGNLYLNRTITGAIVARQPFGGFNMSGFGSKAGGPDYLKQFMVARSISENLMRHGFAPMTEEEVSGE